jgi:hypothetical protein
MGLGNYINQLTGRGSANTKQNSALNKEENDIRLRQNASFIGSSNDPFSTPPRDNYQTYPYDYYAGPDCKIFFGDIWVDDIVSIQYNVSQSKTPIYGYASQTFDAIARGQVLIQGTLTIQFKETGYLNIIQSTLESQRSNVSEIIRSKVAGYNKLNDTKNLKFTQGLTYVGDPGQSRADVVYSANGSPQIIRQQQTIEQILTSKKATTALNKTIGGTAAEDFEDFAEILEDSIWGDSNGKSLGLENKLKRADEFDYNSNGGITTSKSSKGNNYSEVLNIMLTFGDINDFRAEHTLVVLNDVHFTSSSMIITPEGVPIAEEYTFIARNINDSINPSANTININPIKLNVGNDSIKLSTLDDVKSIEDYLDKNNTIVRLEIKAGLGSNGWETKNIIFEREQFSFNKIEPFVDQVIKITESVINEKISTDYSQYIVDADFGNSIGVDIVNPKITMILEQTIANTKTYKVISPTRTGFSSISVLTRDDLFDAKAMEPSIQSKPITTQKPPKTSQKVVKEVSVTTFDNPQIGDIAVEQSEINRLKEVEKQAKQSSRVDEQVRRSEDLAKQQRISKEMQEDRNSQNKTKYGGIEQWDRDQAILNNLENRIDTNFQYVKDTLGKPVPWFDVTNPWIPKHKGPDGKWYYGKSK